MNYGWIGNNFDHRYLYLVVGLQEKKEEIGTHYPDHYRKDTDPQEVGLIVHGPEIDITAPITTGKTTWTPGRAQEKAAPIASAKSEKNPKTEACFSPSQDSSGKDYGERPTNPFAHLI